MTAGSERPPRASSVYTAFMGPCVLAGAPTRRSAGHFPWMSPPGGPAGQPHRGGGAAILGAPLFAPPGTVGAARPGHAPPPPPP